MQIMRIGRKKRKMQITRIGTLKETELAGDLLYGRQLANRTILYINIHINIYQ